MASTAKILYQGGASNVLFTDRRYFYPETEVYEYWKNITQFLTWVSMISRKPTPDALYKIFEDSPTFQNQYFYNNSATVTIASTGAESNDVAIDNITNLTQAGTADNSMVNLLCEVWDSAGTTKRGVCYISSVTSTTQVKFKTAKATAIATVDNDIFRVIGTVRGELSVAGEAYFNELSMVWNSTHYFSLPIEITGKLYKEVKLRGVSNELGRLREKKFKEMKMQVQNGLLKSTSTLGTNFNASDTFTEANLRTTTDSDSNTSSVRTTYGFIPILEDYGIEWTGTGAMNANTNIFTIPSSALDYDVFTDMSKVIHDKRENNVIPGFCGFGFMAEMAKKVVDNKKFGFLGKVQLGDTAINSLGFDVRNLFTPFGTIQLIPTKALSNEYENYCLLPNDQAIGIREYEPWQYKTNIKTDNDYNAVKDVINYDAGLQMNLLPTHHMIRLTA
jgi:hypothetical protein